MIICSLVGLSTTLARDKMNVVALSYVQMISTSVVYFRGFLYLEVFDSFRHLINMIIGVTNSIFTTLFVFAYILLAFTILFTKSLGNYSFIESLKINFNSIFGNLPEDGDDFVLDFSVWVLVISIGIITTLILSNFLIAVMSSRYAELELEQTIISLKGKADMVEEIEVFLNAFEKKKSKKKIDFIGEKSFLIILTNDFASNDSKINKIRKKDKRNKDKEFVKKKILEIEQFLNFEKKVNLKKQEVNQIVIEELKDKLELTNSKIEDLKNQNENLKNFYEEKMAIFQKENDLKKYQIDEIREMIFEILEKKQNLSIDVKSHYEKSILKIDGEVKIDNKLKNFQNDMADKFETIEGKMGIILDFITKDKNIKKGSDFGSNNNEGYKSNGRDKKSKIYKNYSKDKINRDNQNYDDYRREENGRGFKNYREKDYKRDKNRINENSRENDFRYDNERDKKIIYNNSKEFEIKNNFNRDKNNLKKNDFRDGYNNSEEIDFKDDYNIRNKKNDNYRKNDYRSKKNRGYENSAENNFMGDDDKIYGKRNFNQNLNKKKSNEINFEDSNYKDRNFKQRNSKKINYEGEYGYRENYDNDLNKKNDSYNEDNNSDYEININRKKNNFVDK